MTSITAAPDSEYMSVNVDFSMINVALYVERIELSTCKYINDPINI